MSRLLTERLQDNECLIVTGAERFSDYAGYASSFQWAGNHVDQTHRYVTYVYVILNLFYFDLIGKISDTIFKV